jgi:hypothetical protein
MGQGLDGAGTRGKYMPAAIEELHSLMACVVPKDYKSYK